MPPSSARCGHCQQPAPYQCPKCHVTYCSVPCYRNHAESCTEEFYRDRVEQIQAWQSHDTRKQTLQILQRVYQQQININDYVYGGGGDDDSDNDDDDDKQDYKDSWGRQELRELLDALETVDHDTVTRLVQAQPQLDASIKRDIQSGVLTKWLVQETWVPWWRPQRQGEQAHQQATLEPHVLYQAPIHQPILNEPSIDDRLLRVPLFSKLLRQTKGTPLLQYNLIDLIYAYCWTERLYFGQTLPEDAAHTFVTHASRVMAHKARYTSLPQVLHECTRASTASNSCNTPWDILCHDIVHLCRQGRAVLRALIIVQGWLQTARNWRKQAKQVEYYLSWAIDNQQHNHVNLYELSDQVEEWCTHWQHLDGMHHPIQELKLPTSVRSTPSPITPFITPIATTETKMKILS